MGNLNKAKVIVFGAGGAGNTVYSRISDKYDVIAFSDNNERKQNTTLFGIPIIAPAEIAKTDYDYIFIGADARESIIRQLVEKYAIKPEKILDEPLRLAAYTARRMALKSARDLIMSRGLTGSVAEAGVFQGEFAREINRVFPDRTLYLFDTFEGFDKRDVVLEDKSVGALENEFNIDTAADYVLSVMPHKERCIIKQGFFPDSTRKVDDAFVFVSLDMDLYQPTLEGLKFFYPKLKKGGFIFIHDYFTARFTGIAKAVEAFATDCELHLCPLGDECTLIVVK